jgi:lipoprotein-releasing system permease protein
MFELAIRHLMSRKRQSALTLVGIILGTAAYIVISGMMLGFQTFIIDQLINNDAHVRVSAREEIITEHSLDEAFFGDFLNQGGAIKWISPPSGRRDQFHIENPKSWFDRLDRSPEVLAFSPQLVTQAIATRGAVSIGARVIGILPEKQTRVTNIAQHMVDGEFGDLSKGGNQIVVGDGLLQKLGARTNDTLMLSVGKTEPQPFKIKGSFHLGVKGLDDSLIYGNLGDIQKLNQTPSRITDIAIRLHDVEDASSLASDWNDLSRDKVQSWDQANEGIMSVFKTQDIVRNSMTVSILIVAGFGIYNILSMAIQHKRREIAILRSMGFESKDIVTLFLTQGMILGAIGGVVGCVIGYVLCLGMEQIPVAERGMGGNRMIVVYFASIYINGFFLAFGSSSVASFLPARSAGRMTPIEIIRNENAT